MTLKIFRLLHVYNVVNTLKYVMEIASEISFNQRYRFVNFLSWTLAGLKFLLALHYFACGWIWMYKYKFNKEWDVTYFSEPSEKVSIYVDSFYLITTTVSTVGYGDFKAYIDSDGVYTAEMVYLYFVTMFGITLFSSVTNEIFSYKRVRSIQEIVTKRV